MLHKLEVIYKPLVFLYSKIVVLYLILKKGSQRARKVKSMKTLNDLREYAKAKEMNESDIERLIDEVESDGNGYITDEVYNDICYGIDCETENI